jgi:hypothetical protein
MFFGGLRMGGLYRGVSYHPDTDPGVHQALNL